MEHSSQYKIPKGPAEPETPDEQGQEKPSRLRNVIDIGRGMGSAFNQGLRGRRFDPRLIELNRERRRRGLPPLRESPRRGWFSSYLRRKAPNLR